MLYFRRPQAWLTTPQIVPTTPISSYQMVKLSLREMLRGVSLTLPEPRNSCAGYMLPYSRRDGVSLTAQLKYSTPGVGHLPLWLFL